MQLWKKNYIAVLAGVLFLLAVGTGGFISMFFYEGFRQELKNSLAQKKMLQDIITSEEEENSNLILLGNSLRESGQYIRLKDNAGVVWINTMPFQEKNKKSQLVKRKGREFMVFKDEIFSEELKAEFVYARDVSFLYSGHRNRIWAAVGMLVSSGIILGGIFYKIMKKIYTPVNQIAHELKTPLTVIQGYGQYLMAAVLEKEDEYFAKKQIILESAKLREIIDRLLIMGNIREGKIRIMKISANVFFRKIEEEYKGIIIENQVQWIWGDEILLSCLFRNLISNGRRRGNQIMILASKEKISVWNSGASMEKRKIERLNKNKQLSPGEFEGNGYGIEICREIMHLHKGKLVYNIPKQGGTEAVLVFPKKSIIEKKMQ